MCLCLLGNAAHRGKWFAQGRPQGNGTFFVLMVRIIGRKFGGGGCVTELAGWRQHHGEKGYACVEHAGRGCRAVGQVVPCPVVDRSVLLSTKLKLSRCSGL